MFYHYRHSLLICQHEACRHPGVGCVMIFFSIFFRVWGYISIVTENDVKVNNESAIICYWLAPVGYLLLHLHTKKKQFMGIAIGPAGHVPR
jgi:hypothetical protein